MKKILTALKLISITDGIDMGCMENKQKGFVDKKLFKKEKVEGKEVEGTECAERIIIPKKALRGKTR